MYYALRSPPFKVIRATGRLTRVRIKGPVGSKLEAGPVASESLFRILESEARSDGTEVIRVKH